MTPEELRKVKSNLAELKRRQALEPKFGRRKGKKKDGDEISLREFKQFLKETGQWPPTRKEPA